MNTHLSSLAWCVWDKMRTIEFATGNRIFAIRARIYSFVSTQWTSRVSFPSTLRCYVTKFASPASGKPTFHEWTVVYRAGMWIWDAKWILDSQSDHPWTVLHKFPVSACSDELWELKKPKRPKGEAWCANKKQTVYSSEVPAGLYTGELHGIAFSWFSFQKVQQWGGLTADDHRKQRTASEHSEAILQTNSCVRLLSSSKNPKDLKEKLSFAVLLSNKLFQFRRFLPCEKLSVTRLIKEF